MKKLFAVVLCLAALAQAQTRIKGVLMYDQVTVTFSATPTFDASKANVFKLTLTGNVTSSTLSNVLFGQDLMFEICQDGTGGRTFVAPANVLGFLAISSTASACTTQEFIFDGTNAQPLTATAIVSAINGVSFSASPSTHSIPVITAANTATWKVVPDCTDTTGNHINYTQSTDVWSCGTSVPANTVTTTGSQTLTSKGFGDKVLLYNNVSTAGAGLTAVFGYARQVSATTAITTTTIITSQAADTLYKIDIATACDSASASATVNVTIKFTDTSNTVQTLPGLAVSTCTTLGTGSAASTSFPFIAKASTAIQYSTVIANTPTYDVRIAVTQLGTN